ncbi:dihydrolipoyl dehydrogenase [Candidatus Woesearchaeota archaeon]|nr:dihydrolipoyl dehydrogenase [Candidatus Woesearchaeota archaeon]
MTDVAIIGAGPGGYVAAIKCAQLGKRVTLIDRENVGGVCLHHGCIPTKALIHAADIFHDAGKAKDFGVTFSNVAVDFAKTQEWKSAIIKKLESGVRTLLKAGKVEIIQGEASFASSKSVIVKTPSGESALDFDKCIIATGSSERMLPGVAVDGEAVMTSTHAVELKSVPKSLLVIGGGYIGIELSQMFAKFGTQITIVEALPRILSLLDPEFSAVVEKELKAMGAAIYVNSKVLKSEKRGSGVATSIQLADGSTKEISTEKAILSIGRVPHTESLHLEKTKVQVDKGFIVVNTQLQTADPSIFALGDVIGGAMLAHKATAEAKVAAEVIAGKNSSFGNLVPYAIFSDPEIAGVGLTEEEAKKKGLSYTVKKFRSASEGKAQILGDSNAFFKAILGPNKEFLGLHICGDRASDMIGEAVLALEMGASAEDLALIIHPHPTLVESYGELADVILGKPTHSL